MKRLYFAIIAALCCTMLVSCGGEDTPPTLSDPNGVILEEIVIEEITIKEITIDEIVIK